MENDFKNFIIYSSKKLILYNPLWMVLTLPLALADKESDRLERLEKSDHPNCKKWVYITWSRKSVN